MAKTTYNIPSSAGDIKEIYDKIEDYFSSVQDFKTILVSSTPDRIDFICKTSYRYMGIPVKNECKLTREKDGYTLSVNTKNEELFKVQKIWFVIVLLALAFILFTKLYAATILLISISMIFLTDNSRFTKNEEKRITENIDKAVKRMI